jgi:hypothetical protein
MNDPRQMELLMNDAHDFVSHINQLNPLDQISNQAEVNQVLKYVESYASDKSPHLPRQFFVVESVQGHLVFSQKLEEYFSLKGDFKLGDLYAFIGDQYHSAHYLREFLFWSKAAYLFYHSIKDKHDVRLLAFCARFPMRLYNGESFWVVRETKPLALNQQNQLLSHINTFTIENHFHEHELVDISFEVYYNKHYHPEWNQQLRKFRFAIQPFQLLAAQTEILKFYHEHVGANTVNCSEALKYPRNTIKKYISDSQHHRGIIDKARIAFPHITFNCMHDVIDYLDKIGWFNQ